MTENKQTSEAISMIPSHILEVLKEFKEHRDNMTCLECGYKGMMGVKDNGMKPFSSAFWALLVVFCVGVFGLVGIFASPAIFGAAWAFIMKASAKPILACPNCKSNLHLA